MQDMNVLSFQDKNIQSCHTPWQFLDINHKLITEDL